MPPPSAALDPQQGQLSSTGRFTGEDADMLAVDSRGKKAVDDLVGLTDVMIKRGNCARHPLQSR